MRKERTNIYITERQKKQLEQRSQEENLPIAELIRRALDAYLAWDDPTYHPDAPLPKEGTPLSSPCVEAQELSASEVGNRTQHAVREPSCTPTWSTWALHTSPMQTSRLCGVRR